MRNLRRIRHHLDLDSAKLLATALVSSRVDYCNSILYGIADIDLTRLQFQFLTYKTLREKQPIYLHSILAASTPSRSLRSNNDNSLLVPRVKTNTGARAVHSFALSLGKTTSRCLSV